MYKLDYYNRKFKTESRNISPGTEEWLNGRQFCFGGSEMGTLLNLNKHEKFPKLIYNKYVKTYKQCDQTEWGHLFEAVAKIYILEDYDNIYEFPSIPHSKYPVCYSPDGIMVDEEADDLILLEIKSPIYRGVQDIPETYLAQVYTGMCVLDVKNCLFAQFRFRRCKFGTPPWNSKYDRTYHREFRNRQSDTTPISFGYLWWNLPCEFHDLCEDEEMIDIIKGLPKPCILIEDDKFTASTGVILMWKLFEVKHSIIDPKPNFLDDNAKMLWANYKQLRGAKDRNPDEVYKELKAQCRKAKSKKEVKDEVKDEIQDSVKADTPEEIKEEDESETKAKPKDKPKATLKKRKIQPKISFKAKK